MQIYYQYLLNYKNIINVCIQLILEVYTSYTRNWYKYCILLNLFSAVIYCKLLVHIRWLHNS